MAEQPVQHNEIIEIDKTIAGIKQIIKEMEKLQKTIKDTAKTLLAFQQSQNVSTPGGKQAVQGGAQEIQKLVKEQNKLKVSTKELTKEKVRLQEANRKNRQSLKQEIALEQSAVGSVNRMRAEYNKMSRQFNETADKSLRKKMIPEMQRLDREIKKNEEAVGKHQRSVGRYQKAFDGAKRSILALGAGMVGATAIIRGMGRAMKNSISIVLNFDQAMADVAAITRATDVEIGMLRNAAKALGGTTKFTASEVAGLQKELGKLGFTVSEILAGTGGILALAAATGEDLAKSSEVAGNAIRAFGLDASETGRVADVMARAFTGSALNLERFSVAMRSVAPVAKAFGFTIEETTALLGSLANAGFDASMAGTATRNILLNLADTSGALAKRLGGAVNSFDELIPALIELREGGVDLNETLALTDKRSVAAFNRFLEGAEFTRQFKDELVAAAGAAEEMAEIQLNTLRGDLTILKSAFEVLIIEVQDTNSELGEAARGGVQLATKGLVALKEETAETETFFDKFRKTIIRTVAPTGLPALIDLLRLGKKEMTEFGDATEDAADNTRILTWEQQQLFDLEEKKKKEDAAAKLIKEKKAADDLFLANQRLITSKKILAQFAADTAQVESRLNKQLIDQELERARGILTNFASETELVEKSLNLDLAVADAKDKIAQDQADNVQNALNLEHQAELASNQKVDTEKENAKTSQKISLGQSIISLAQGLANTAKAGFPLNIPLIIGYLGQIGGIIGTISSIKFAEGGHGELHGPSHSQGGIHIPGVGEAQGKEYFGVINQQMTRKYRQDLPGIFDAINAGKFHEVWDKSNIQLQANIDPWTKKIYDTLQTQANIYTDSNGDTVKEYPSGYKQIILR